MEQAFKLFSATEKEDLKKIRNDIHELNLTLSSHLPEAAEKAVRKEIASMEESLEAAKKTTSNIRSKSSH